jgi:hypothetical protein
MCGSDAIASSASISVRNPSRPVLMPKSAMPSGAAIRAAVAADRHEQVRAFEQRAFRCEREFAILLRIERDGEPRIS